MHGTPSIPQLRSALLGHVGNALFFLQQTCEGMTAAEMREAIAEVADMGNASPDLEPADEYAACRERFTKASEKAAREESRGFEQFVAQGWGVRVTLCEQIYGVGA